MSLVKTVVSRMGLPKNREDETDAVWLRSWYVWERSCEVEPVPWLTGKSCTLVWTWFRTGGILSTLERGFVQEGHLSVVVTAIQLQRSRLDAKQRMLRNPFQLCKFGSQWLHDLQPIHVPYFCDTRERRGETLTSWWREYPIGFLLPCLASQWTAQGFPGANKHGEYILPLPYQA